MKSNLYFRLLISFSVVITLVVSFVKANASHIQGGSKQIALVAQDLDLDFSDIRQIPIENPLTMVSNFSIELK